MKLEDILNSDLVTDDDPIQLTIFDDGLPLREHWKGNWFNDQILEHSALEVEQIRYEKERGWYIYLRR